MHPKVDSWGAFCRLFVFFEKFKNASFAVIVTSSVYSAFTI